VCFAEGRGGAGTDGGRRRFNCTTFTDPLAPPGWRVAQQTAPPLLRLSPTVPVRIPVITKSLKREASTTCVLAKQSNTAKTANPTGSDRMRVVLDILGDEEKQ